ncbi:HAMP domain-containing sensor histidine kinase [Pseudarthrobacter sp. NamE2]|uniref:sensor histidine kinase n=1 Tax=Pseudarthrobacter sp. NamE2 TaxID=2576838 RepID=UPI0010FF1E7D|nr:HAMP domain-containing sensor histidine kinase [Pseudarthrobacter sp. NamE2]
MRDTSVFMPLDDFFSKIGRRRAIVLCQIPVSLAMGLITFFTFLFSPASLTNAVFLITLVLHLLILVASLACPWNRLPAAAFVVIPVADCLALAVTREVGGPVLSIVGLLIAFPVIWLAVSASKTRLALAITAPLLGTIVSPLALGSEIEQRELIRMILFPVIMGGLAITAHLVAEGVLKHRNIRDQKDRELVRLHESTKNHEQLLDAVLETVNVGVWAIDTDGGDILTNRRLRADRTMAQQMPGVNPFVVGPDQSAQAMPDHPAKLALKGDSFTNKLIRVGAGEQQQSFSVTAKPLQDKEGRQKGSVLAFTNVTDLVTALEARDKFVATVSHELRTPLTPMLGYLELLKDEPDAGYIDVIDRNAQRLLTLINDLLLVASEDLEIRRRPANLSKLLKQAARNAEPEASAKGITLNNHIPGGLQAEVDPEQFTRAITLLLSNAIKFSPNGSEVKIGLRQHNDRFTCSIQDQGIGMTEEEQEHAFTKFFRSDHAMKTAVPGAGLGLSISKAIIEAHNGQIRLKSRPGGGTTVTVSLST